MSYDLPAFLQRIAACLSHFTANPPGNDQILQPSPAISSRLDPSISGTAEPMALPAMARCIFIAAVGWPRDGPIGVKLGATAVGKLWPPDFWQFLILLWWKYVKMMNDEALNVELPHLHTKPYWMFDLNIWGKFSFRKVVGRKRSWRLLRQLICWTFPLEAKVKMTDPLNGMVIWLQCKFYLDDRMIPNVRLHCEPHCWTIRIFTSIHPTILPVFIHVVQASKVVCASCSKLGHHKGFLARSLKGEAGQVSLPLSVRSWKKGGSLVMGIPGTPSYHPF